MKDRRRQFGKKARKIQVVALQGYSTENERQRAQRNWEDISVNHKAISNGIFLLSCLRKQ